MNFLVLLKKIIIKMVESSEVLVVKVFNYICGIGGVVELLYLLKYFFFLVKKIIVYELILWFEN